MYYSFENNALEYEEIKKLLSVKPKKECSKYGIEYNELIEDKKDEEFSKNGLKYKEIKRLLRIVLKKEENKYSSSKNGLKHNNEIKKLMLVITKKECSKYGVEYNELIEDQYKKVDGIIKHQKVEDIKMPKSSKNEKR